MQSLMPGKQAPLETERYSSLQLTKRFVFGRQRGESQRSNLTQVFTIALEGYALFVAEFGIWV